MQVNLIAQGLGDDTLAGAVRDAAAGGGFDRLDVAVAYATKQGLLTLERALGGFPPKSRWVVGLDDAISQPEALAYLFALPGAKLRLAALAPQRRFHPKVYCLRRSGDPAAGLSAIGSGNMTDHGLRLNGEAAVLLTAESEAEVAALKTQWKALWALGEEASQAALDAYTLTYKKAKAARKKMADAGEAPAVPEDAEPVVAVPAFDGTVATAGIAWTEGASPSAEGRDLELPRAMMPFFALSGLKAQRWFQAPNHERFQLTFTYRPKNDMWRLMFSRDAVKATIGRESLRPITGEARSDLAIVFTKIANSPDYDLRMVTIGSEAHAQIMKRSDDIGSLQSTKGKGSRNFGFF